MKNAIMSPSEFPFLIVLFVQLLKSELDRKNFKLLKHQDGQIFTILSCTADSGGPLFANDMLIGVVSFGIFKISVVRFLVI